MICLSNQAEAAASSVVAAQRLDPDQLALAAARLGEHGAGAVERGQLEEHRAGLLAALLDDKGLRAGDFGAADQGADEETGFEAGSDHAPS